MSPVLPREERDAIRARHLAWHNSDPSDATWPDDLAAVIVDAQSQSPRRAAVQAAMAHEIVREDVPALLDALGAAEEENAEHRRNEVTLTNELGRARQDATEFCEQRDAARAEVTALRGRIDGLDLAARIEAEARFCEDHSRPDTVQRDRQVFQEGAWWVRARLRATTVQAADEGERTGR